MASFVVSEIRIESYASKDIEETELGCRSPSSPHNIQSILATNRPFIVNSNSVAMQTELNWSEPNRTERNDQMPSSMKQRWAHSIVLSITIFQNNYHNESLDMIYWTL